MNKQLQSRLKKYSALSAGATLIATIADAQIVTRTINETITDFGDTPYEIDLDEDGMVDFTIFGADFTDSMYGFWGLNPGRAGWAWMYGNYGYNQVLQNGYVAGTYGPYGWWSTPPVPGDINNDKGAKIGSAGDFLNLVELVGGFYGTFDSVSFGVNDGWAYGGSLAVGNETINEKSNTYVGVQFIKEDDNGDFHLHYGWIRFTNVGRVGETITIAEVGYDAQPYVVAITDDSYITEYAQHRVKADESDLASLEKGVQTSNVVHEYGNYVSYFSVTIVRDDEFNPVNIVFDAVNGNTYYLGEDDFTGTGLTDYNNMPINKGESYKIYMVTWSNDDEPMRMTSIDAVIERQLNINDIKSSVLDVYSSNNVVYINAGSDNIGSPVRIFDITGKEVYNGVISTNKEEINLNVNTGVYIVSINGKLGKSSKKVVIK